MRPRYVMIPIGVVTTVAWCGWSGSKWQAPNKVCSNIRLRVVKPLGDLMPRSICKLNVALFPPVSSYDYSLSGPPTTSRLDGLVGLNHPHFITEYFRCVVPSVLSGTSTLQWRLSGCRTALAGHYVGVGRDGLVQGRRIVFPLLSSRLFCCLQ